MQEENYTQNISNMYRVYFFLSLIFLTKAQIPSFGFCPNYLPMAHFDMDRFLGKWYEAERYFQFSEVASRCVVADYAVGPNGKIYVSNEVTNRFTGVKRIIGGNLDLAGKKTEGRFVVKYDTQPISTTSVLTVLDTDYENYAVIWSCSGLGPVNAQSAWLMTRERIPDTTALQPAYGVLDGFKISRTFFVKTDQEGCAIAASDLNAALGIASTSTNVDQNADVDTGKTAAESNEVKPQTIPEVVLKRAEEIKLTNEENLIHLSKPVDTLSTENTVQEENLSSTKVPDKLKLEDDPAEAIKSGDISLAELSEASIAEIENISENEKKDTTTAINEPNGENDLLDTEAV